MQFKIIHTKIIGIIVVILISFGAWSQPYTMKKNTINSGGGEMTSNNNRYQLKSSIGQVDASQSQTDGNNRFTLTGGFWAGNQAIELTDIIFKNSFEQ